jgi:programmed cell death protein 5
MPDEDELEELRQERMEELRERQQGEGDEEAVQRQQEEAEAQKQAILRQYLSDGARKRLNTVKMSRPDHGEQVEQQIIALAQSGRLGDQITEEQMKEILSEMSPDSKSFDIRRR